MKFLAKHIATESLCGGALCVGQGGGRSADGGHGAKRFAARASRGQASGKQASREVAHV